MRCGQWTEGALSTLPPWSTASGLASRTYHGVDPGAGDRPRTLLRDDQFPAARIERGARALDGDLHLTRCGRGGSGRGIDRAVADHE